MGETETHDRSEGEVISSMLIAAWGNSGRFYIPTINFQQSGVYLLCYSLVAPKNAINEIVGFKSRSRNKLKRRAYNTLSAPNVEIIKYMEKNDMLFVSETLSFHVTVVPSPIIKAKCQPTHMAKEKNDDCSNLGGSEEKSVTCTSDAHHSPDKVIAPRCTPELTHQSHKVTRGFFGLAVISNCVTSSVTVLLLDLQYAKSTPLKISLCPWAYRVWRHLVAPPKFKSTGQCHHHAMRLFLRIGAQTRRTKMKFLWDIAPNASRWFGRTAHYFSICINKICCSVFFFSPYSRSPNCANLVRMHNVEKRLARKLVSLK